MMTFRPLLAPRRWAVFGLFCASMIQSWPAQPSKFTVCCEALRAAVGFAETGTVSNPFAAAPTGPTAHVAPGYPVAAGLIIRTLGKTPEAFFVLELMASLSMALLIAGMPIASQAIGLGFASGFAGALAYLAARVPTFTDWEASYVALLTLSLSVLLFRHATRLLDMRYLLALGLLWGAASLTNPIIFIIYLLWLPAVAILALLNRQKPSLRLAVALLPLLIVLSWTLRNWSIFGSFVLVRSNLGLELAVSNNDCSTGSLKQNIHNGCFEPGHPNVSRLEVDALRNAGEVAYNASKLRASLLWIKSNPRRFCDLTLDRFARFWFPSDKSPLWRALVEEGNRWRTAAVWLMTLLSVPGFVLLVRGGHRFAAGLLAAWLILFPGIYYVIQYDDRYRVPILWVTFLLAGHFMAVIARRCLPHFFHPAPQQ